jgi:hypothetical protein
MEGGASEAQYGVTGAAGKVRRRAMLGKQSAARVKLTDREVRLAGGRSRIQAGCAKWGLPGRGPCKCAFSVALRTPVWGTPA